MSKKLFKKGNIPWNKGTSKPRKHWKEYWKKYIVRAICKYCKKEFDAYDFDLKRGRGLYCSHECSCKCHIKNKRGKDNHLWKNGKYIDRYGYVNIAYWDGNVRKYAKEHRLIMGKYLGRELENWENVHHKNKIKSDNRIENLQLVINKNHYGEIRCPHCLKEFLIK